jgi:hypothetical protein
MPPRPTHPAANKELPAASDEQKQQQRSSPTAVANFLAQTAAENLNKVALNLCASLQTAGDTLRATRKAREEGGAPPPTAVWELRWRKRTAVLAMPRYGEFFSDADEAEEAERRGGGLFLFFGKVLERFWQVLAKLLFVLRCGSCTLSRKNTCPAGII